MVLVDLINIDVKALICVLFWYNLIVIITNFVYWITVKSESEFNIFKIFTLAKVFQASAFFLLFYRDRLPDLLSVNIGNSLLFIGFFCESLSIYEILEIKTKKYNTWLVGVLSCSLIFFNITEFFVPSPSIRVASSSGGVFAILLIPSLSLMFSKKSKSFKRVTGIFYLTFTILLVPRIVYMMWNSQASLFTNNVVQSLTFLSLIMVNVYSSTTFLLQLKENADKADLRLIRTDYLTNLSNRYYFLKLVEDSFGVHKSEKLSLTVLLIDFDKLRNINNKYGYCFGDKVLVAFSDILRANLGSDDLMCRYNSEEFLAVLPNSDADEGYAKAQKILDEVHATRFDEYPDFIFTVSIGVVSGYPSESDIFVDYLEEADRQLYLAKTSGGNRIEFKALNA